MTAAATWIARYGRAWETADEDEVADLSDYRPIEPGVHEPQPGWGT